MSRRRSPVRHPVKSHTRNGKRIDSFSRGSGQKPRRSSRVVGDNNMSLVDMSIEYDKILQPFFDKELTTGERRDDSGGDMGGFVESKSTGKRYIWGDDWVMSFGLAASRMVKYLDKVGLLPSVKKGDPEVFSFIKRGARHTLVSWLKKQHDM